MANYLRINKRMSLGKGVIIQYLILGLLLFSCNKIVALEIDNDFENLKNQKYKALGGNIFAGYGLLKGNISEYFTDPFFIGINVDILRQKMVIQIDDYIGFGKTKKTMEFPNNLEWSKNKAALHGALGGNFGYTLINSEAFKLVPLVGIGAGLLSSPAAIIGVVSENSINEPFLPYYKIGCYIDIKSLKLFKKSLSFNYDDNYTCIRLSFGLNNQIGTPKYASFYKGRMLYFTIGMGGLAVGGLAR